MVNGTVKFFNGQKSYGFIDGDDGTSYFVHSSGLAEGTEIDEGDKVSFDGSEGEKGPKAENVKKLDSNEEAPAEKEEAEAEAGNAEEAPAEEIQKAA